MSELAPETFTQQFTKFAVLGVRENGERSSYNYWHPHVMSLHEVVGLIQAARQMEKNLIKQSASFMSEEDMEHLLGDLGIEPTREEDKQ